MKLMHRALIGAIVLAVSCGGGGGGNQSSPPLPQQFVPGSALTIVANDGVTVQFGGTSYAVPTVVEVTVSRNWSKHPRSSAVQLQQQVTIKPPPSEASALSILFAVKQNADEMLGVGLDENGLWGPLSTLSDGSRLTVRLPNRSRATSRAGDSLILGLVRTPTNTPDAEVATQFKLLAGEGPIGTVESFQAAILVHGVRNTVADMQKLARSLVDQHLYEAVYGLAYPSRQDITANSRAFTNLLEQQLTSGRHVTVFGHSAGGVLAYYAIERLRASSYVDMLFALGAPRMGAKAALESSEWCGSEQKANLNDPEDTAAHWAGLCQDAIAPSTLQLKPGSGFLTELNGARSNHTNYVIYDVTAGVVPSYGLGGDLVCTALHAGKECDGAVAVDEVLDFDFVGKSTLNSIDTHRLRFGHRELITSPTLLAHYGAMIRYYRDRPKPLLQIEATNTKATNTGWDFRIKINPAPGKQCVMEYLPMQAFNRAGTWTTTQWFSQNTPGGAFHPQKPANLNLDLAVGKLIPVHLGFDFDRHPYDQAEYSDRAKTVVVVATGRIVGEGRFSVKQQFTLQDRDGSGPAPPRLATVRSSSPQNTAVFSQPL